ncbi:MAG: DUF2092 domain-containing protein [Gammaproteobacteria bacterium]|nr:MAG: DUF2092 domain-containing protein [Gammaproteobacteria bacterium]
MKSKYFLQAVFYLSLISSTSLYAAGEAKVIKHETSDKTIFQVVSKIDPFVDNLIKQASDYLTSAKSFSLRTEVTVEEVMASGQKIQLSRSGEILIRHPDRMHVEVTSDNGVIRLYFDGTKLSRFDLDKNIFASIDAPGTLEAALDHAMKKYHVDAPLADLLAGNPYENYIANTDEGFYAGLHYLEGKEYHHLALSNENVDYQVWIADGPAPLFRKIVITYKHLPGAPQFTAELSDWDFNPRTPDLAFDFYPPIDAEQIEFLPVTVSKSGVKK